MEVARGVVDGDGGGGEDAVAHGWQAEGEFEEVVHAIAIGIVAGDGERGGAGACGGGVDGVVDAGDDEGRGVFCDAPSGETAGR